MDCATPRSRAEIDEAIADYTEKIRLVPRRISGRGIEGKWHLQLRKLYRGRGQLYEMTGDYDQAIEDYSEVIKSFIQGRADYWSDLICDHFSRARCYLHKCDYEGAIGDFTAMIDLHSSSFLAGFNRNAACHKLRGEAYGKTGDFENAINDLTEAIRIDPEDRCYIPCPLKFCLTNETAFDPEKAGWKRRRALAILATVYASSGDFGQARQYQRRLLELSDLSEDESAEARKCLAVYDDQANEEERAND